MRVKVTPRRAKLGHEHEIILVKRYLAFVYIDLKKKILRKPLKIGTSRRKIFTRKPQYEVKDKITHQSKEKERKNQSITWLRSGRNKTL